MAVNQKKPLKVAIIEPWCTGCGGAPVCAVYCKFDALHLVRDEKTYPFMMMTVDDTRCMGCGCCAAGDRQGIMLAGCPWNAIRLTQRTDGR